MKLYSEKTNHELRIGDEVTTSSGERGIIVYLEPPLYSHQSGYITARMESGCKSRYYASVFNCRFKETKQVALPNGIDDLIDALIAERNHPKKRNTTVTIEVTDDDTQMVITITENAQ